MSIGTAILVDKSTTPLVKDHGTLSAWRAQYITFQAPEGGILTIVNIYAPNSSNDRAPLWWKLSQADLASDNYIVGGDFNYAEGKNRGKALGESRMLRREAAAWHQMTIHYGLTNAWNLNSFRKMSRKDFTFDNGRAGPRSSVSRLDKFMVSQEIMERGGRIETAASVRKLSDHSPLVMTVWGNQPPPENPPHYFDISLLAKEELRKEMVAAWNGDQERPPSNQGWPAWLEAAIQRVTSCNARLTKDKRRAQGKHARTHAKKVQLAEIQLQDDSANVEVREILSNAQGKLAEIFQDSVARNRHLSPSTWLRYGNTCSRTFFDFHWVGKKKALIRELETESGTVTSQRDLTDHITDFYKHLYASEADTVGLESAREQCWSSVLPRVSEDTNVFLTQELSISEIFKAINVLPKGKALGHDGLPMEFFHACAKDVAPNLLNAFTRCSKKGRPRPS